MPEHDLPWRLVVFWNKSSGCVQQAASVQPELLHSSELCEDAGQSEGHDPSWVEINPEGTLPRGITGLDFQAMRLKFSF